VALIRESVRWGSLAHTLLQRYTRAGATETEVSARASHEATTAMLAAIGPVYRGQQPFFEGARAGYRGQIGRGSTIPHALANNVVFQPGDVLVTGAAAPVWGYLSELERTMVLGEVEPGFYVSALGGSRHSETVLVTEAGIERLTYYARELEALTIPV
jgi:Xaa-Pro aminopeptidase